MIEWLKQEKIPLLTSGLFIVVALCRRYYQILGGSYMSYINDQELIISMLITSTMFIIFQALLVFSFSAITIHQYNWENSRKKNIAFILICGIAPFIFLYLITLLPSFYQIKSLTLDYAIRLLFMILVVYSLILPNIIFTRILRLKINTNPIVCIKSYFIIAFAAAIYLIFTHAYLHYFTNIDLKNNILNHIFIVTLVIIAFFYLYFWYQTVVNNIPFSNAFTAFHWSIFITMTVTFLILLLLHLCSYVISPYIMIVPLYLIFAGKGIYALILSIIIFCYTFTLSNHRYYKVFHASAIAYIVLILFFGMRNIHLENGLLYGSILLIIINISIAMLIFSSFSRFILKRVLRKMK